MRRPLALLQAWPVLLAFANWAQAGTITLAWDPNSEPDLSGYKIYYGTSSRQYTVTLDVGNVTSYTIPDLDESTVYYFAVTAYDTAGNESDFSDEVSGYPTDRTPPTVVAVTVARENQVEILFSEPVDPSSAENPSNYRIEPGIQVLGAHLDSNQVLVHLVTTPHIDGVTYTIHITGVTDQADPPNAVAEGTKAVYTYHAVDVTAPTVLHVELQDPEHVIVRFSERVDRTSAENAANYHIDPPVAILSARLDSSGYSVLLTTGPHTPERMYTLTISSIRDLAEPPNTMSVPVRFSYLYRLPLRFRFLSAGEYLAGYLSEGDAYYLDRDYRIETIPDSLENVLWIRTAMSDKDNSDPDFLRFEVNQKVSVYVAYDGRVKTFPNWLAQNFVRTKYVVQVSGPADSLILWRKDFAGGEVTLGGNRAAGAQGTRDMYVVLVKPNPNAQADPSDKDNPVSPQQPQNPQEPEQPSEPQEPQSPEQPQEPQQPEQPQQPEDPEQPQEPNNPQEPQQPEQPQEPQKPQEPNQTVGLSIVSTGEYLAGHPKEGERYYLDREYTIEAVPDSLQNATWILTAMSDKDNADSLFLVFRVESDASVYVAYDHRVSSYPDWLVTTFTKTDLVIDVSGPADTLEVWRADFPAGTVILGGNRAQGAEEPRDMYVVLIKKAPNPVPPPQEHETPPPPQQRQEPLPTQFQVYQNYPNPFNPQTEIRFELPEARHVVVAIYNMLGQRVRLLADEDMLPGRYSFTWDARDDYGRPVPGGAYFCRVEAVRTTNNQGLQIPVESWVAVRKMIYLR